MTLEAEERTIAGGADDFMTVRHLRLAGTQHEIGRHLGQLARERLNVRKLPWTDPLMTRVQRSFMAKNWPAHYARMQGAAAAFEADLADDRLDFSFLAYDSGIPGCSCVYYPGSVTADGHAVLSRNFDYTTGGYQDLLMGDGAIQRAVAGEENRPYAGRPFLLETHPEQGYATLGMCAFDLLGMLTDGINSQGLAVALLNDGETLNSPLNEPFGKNGVGISEGQVPRFLLENCASAEEALEALLTTKQYYTAGPCHYLIGDRHGRGFVWEYSSIRNRHHIIDCGERPLPVTNHLLYPHAIPDPEERANSIRRLRILDERIAAQAGSFCAQDIRRINRCAEALEQAGEGQYITATHPSRTLWYAQYDLASGGLEIDFYLGEGAAGGPVRRSPVCRFQLA